MNRTGWIFCGASLAIAIVVSAIGFRFAALPMDKVAAAKTAVGPETLPDIDLPGFGPVSVLDLMSYYIDNPPSAKGGGGAPVATKRFGGC